jgi:hypothetical protein
MNVADIKTQLQNLTGSLASDTRVAARMLTNINNARRELSRRDWQFLQKVYHLRLKKDYITGTVSVNNESNTVTGTNTVWDSTMIGSYITINGAEYYRIITVTSATILIIDQAYIGTNVTNGSYIIRKIYYRVPGDVRKIESMMNFIIPSKLQYTENNVFNAFNPDYSITGDQTEVTEWGRYNIETTYGTGTVASGTVNGNIINGSGTTWLSTVIPGDKVILNGTTVYNVDRVNSNTQIVLCQKMLLANISNDITIYPNPDSIMVRFNSNANADRIIPINYYHRAYDFVNIYDEDEFTRLYPELVIEGALIWEKRCAEDASWVTDYNGWKNSSIPESMAGNKREGVWKPNISRY